MSTLPTKESSHARQVVRKIRGELKRRFLDSVSLLENEKQNDFLVYSKRLYEGLEPVGAVEEEIVNRIIGTMWRLKRVPRFESLILSELDFDIQVKRAADYRAYLDDLGRGLYEKPWTFKSNIQDMFKQDFVDAAGKEVEVRTAERPYTPGQGLMLDSTDRTFGLLRRYETRLERSLFAVMAQLERLQYKRLATSSSVQPLPLASLDVIGDDRDDED